MKLLAIDGGGIRGIYASHILERMHNEHGTVFHREFDLIAGTSTGSIIAAALAFDIPISKVTALYREQGSIIFRPKRWTLGGAVASRYSSEPLREALVSVFEETTLADAKTRLVIPATDIGNGSVHVFKSAYDEKFVRDRNVKVVDAVLASCSAPSYFATAKVGAYHLADGGLWANNPSLVAVTEALTRLKVDRSEIRLLSVGTGIGKNYYPISNSDKKWGFLTGWGPTKFISMLLNLQAATASNVTQLILNKHQSVRVNFESDIPLSLDDVGTLDDLISRADKDFTHNSEAIRQLLGGNQ
jgi:hypothetical protein